MFSHHRSIGIYIYIGNFSRRCQLEFFMTRSIFGCREAFTFYVACRLLWQWNHAFDGLGWEDLDDLITRKWKRSRPQVDKFDLSHKISRRWSGKRAWRLLEGFYNFTWKEEKRKQNRCKRGVEGKSMAKIFMYRATDISSVHIFLSLFFFAFASHVRILMNTRSAITNPNKAAHTAYTTECNNSAARKSLFMTE